jgi:hypothetical protein
LFHGSRNYSTRVGFGRHIRLDEHRTSVARDGSAAFPTAVDDYDLRALLDKSAADGRAEARPAARHDRDSIVQTHAIPNKAEEILR